jgi:uncharacterized membrane protein YeaQ/YmgE (transglycosylase-associated protein family)
MAVYVWCAIGAALGWLGGSLGGQGGITGRIESVLVGIFGAFLGGEFLVAMVLVGKHGLDVATISLSVGTALVCLFLLRAMRRAVGPLKSSVKKRRQA